MLVQPDIAGSLLRRSDHGRAVQHARLQGTHSLQRQYATTGFSKLFFLDRIVVYTAHRLDLVPNLQSDIQSLIINRNIIVCNLVESNIFKYSCVHLDVLVLAEYQC